MSFTLLILCQIKMRSFRMINVAILCLFPCCPPLLPCESTPLVSREFRWWKFDRSSCGGVLEYLVLSSRYSTHELVGLTLLESALRLYPLINSKSLPLLGGESWRRFITPLRLGEFPFLCRLSGFPSLHSAETLPFLRCITVRLRKLFPIPSLLAFFIHHV